jgi:hypothetical protein
MFRNRVFLCETGELVVVEGMIHSVDSVSEQEHRYSIIVRLESTDLN